MVITREMLSTDRQTLMEMTKMMRKLVGDDIMDNWRELSEGIEI